MNNTGFLKLLKRDMDEGVAAFVGRHLKRRKINRHNMLMISDANALKGIANEGSFDYIVSSAPLNDYVHINDSLAKIHRLLSPTGICIGNVETSEQYAKRLRTKYKAIVSKLLEFLSFLFERVAPRLFGIRHVLNKLGVVRHHRMTKCEALGRLRYCGFRIVALQESRNRLYFVTRKSSIPSNGVPCDGLFIKIQKVGLKGRPLHCYKLRTMHAYANYLHDYILDNLQIDNNGKVVGDFRVSVWGKILRKLWLDEMPQLLNVLKGELTFIGLRHLSQEFLELYPEDWRKERLNLRPGFVPPYYADCPKTFTGIIESEKKYYRLKKKYPITTDVYYFVRVVLNFLTMKARTG